MSNSREKLGGARNRFEVDGNLALDSRERLSTRSSVGVPRGTTNTRARTHLHVVLPPEVEERIKWESQSYAKRLVAKVRAEQDTQPTVAEPAQREKKSSFGKRIGQLAASVAAFLTAKQAAGETTWNDPGTATPALDASAYTPGAIPRSMTTDNGTDFYFIEDTTGVGAEEGYLRHWDGSNQTTVSFDSIGSDVIESSEFINGVLYFTDSGAAYSATGSGNTFSETYLGFGSTNGFTYIPALSTYFDAGNDYYGSQSIFEEGGYDPWITDTPNDLIYPSACDGSEMLATFIPNGGFLSDASVVSIEIQDDGYGNPIPGAVTTIAGGVGNGAFDATCKTDYPAAGTNTAFYTAYDSVEGAWVIHALEGTQGGGGPADADGDGYDETVDCDDFNYYVNPGADEVCGDYIDNDCVNGADGPDAIDADTYYYDGDSDGYGDPAIYQNSCTPIVDWVTNDYDWDDANGTVYPGAPEFCDGLDNDQNGMTDDNAVDATAYYYDGDGDGYGDSGIVQYSCVTVPGYSLVGGDEDDANNTVYPGAPELCDQLDNDQNGMVDDGVVYIDWYKDEDGDTYGDNHTAPINACDTPEEEFFVVQRDGDCDDWAYAVNPDAEEVLDGIDNDCDNLVDLDDEEDLPIVGGNCGEMGVVEHPCTYTFELAEGNNGAVAYVDLEAGSELDIWFVGNDLENGFYNVEVGDGSVLTFESEGATMPIFMGYEYVYFVNEGTNYTLERDGDTLMCKVNEPTVGVYVDEDGGWIEDPSELEKVHEATEAGEEVEATVSNGNSTISSDGEQVYPEVEGDDDDSADDDDDDSSTEVPPDPPVPPGCNGCDTASTNVAGKSGLAVIAGIAGLGIRNYFSRKVRGVSDAYYDNGQKTREQMELDENWPELNRDLGW